MCIACNASQKSITSSDLKITCTQTPVMYKIALVACHYLYMRNRIMHNNSSSLPSCISLAPCKDVAPRLDQWETPAPDYSCHNQARHLLFYKEPGKKRIKILVTQHYCTKMNDALTKNDTATLMYDTTSLL